MQVQENYTFNLSISTTSYKDKESIKWNKVNYSNSRINLNLFEQLIKMGYNFCYNFNKSSFTQSEKTINNWVNTSIIFVDIDDSNIEMNEFVNNLSNKPTLYYTTYSNKENSYRFRLVYCFNEIIEDIELYKNLYLSIISLCEIENNFKNKDNCAISVNQQFGRKWF